MPNTARIPRSILITGCSSGIGRCVARGLADRGHRVIASVRQEKDIKTWPHADIPVVLLDLTDDQSIESGLNAALSHTGGTLDALFNNGAFGLPGAVEDLSREALRAQFETNLFGWQVLTNRVIPLMRARGFGRIIQNSSVLGIAALPFRGAYVASKFALEGLSDTLRLELHGTGIDVSLIEPGPITSRFRANAQAAFLRFIPIESSFHANAYRKQLERLNKPGPAAPFTLPPEAVLDRVIHALESRRPKARYPVTVPTYLFSVLRRLLPSRWMDRVLLAASGGGRR
ncbi:SDR family NAD(P)-dependent oxidoreductase [Halothiobacillus sp. 15-55-196]|uniref:SDR family NAD(P)-dependent oxidoreductase n=1 Tax=Halothiobacillus sp. 15-55-196 TaxID=1970382 RepID=UPI0025C1C74D|nr:SDR family NAD(P)-dependent oxidoreductase [Halothiobacillus sp. 15-55-196]